MNHSIIIAVAIISGMPVGSTLAGPALLDFPGPGYREQAERLSPKTIQKTDYPIVGFEPAQTRSFEPSDLLRSFAEPIRLFDVKIGGPKIDFKESPPGPKR